MLSNFFKIALRNLRKHRGFSIINIAGLTLGLTTCLLISCFVWDENMYDRNVPDGDRVYRIYSEFTNNEGTETFAISSPMYATTLQKDFPEVEQTARVMMQAQYKRLFEAGKVQLYEEKGFYVDSTFFRVLDIPFKYGSSQNALNDPGSIVLSEDMAKRFFGNEDPVGKQLLLEKNPLLVRGVFRQDPRFHLQFDYLMPIAALHLPADRMQSWNWQQFYTYVKLKNGADAGLLQTKFQRLVHQIALPFQTDKNAKRTPFLQPLKKIHLYSSSFKFDSAVRGNITYVKALTIIAVFILLIACFNFVNLSTARSLQRAKEVGVRKAIGAARKQLILQFLGETILLAMASLVIAIILFLIALPWLNRFTDKHISIAMFFTPSMPLMLLGMILITGVFAGLYPAIVLSSFKPVNVLKGKTGNEDSPGKVPWLRHGLVVLQFALSVLLIICVAIVFRQVNYLHEKNLGFNKEQIVFFPMRGDNMFKNNASFKNELLQSPYINNVSIGYGFPGDAVAGDEIIVHNNGEQKAYSATQLMVDYDYIKTLGLEMAAGRDFMKEMQTDKDHAYIINETAVKELGFGSADKALGKTLSWHVWGAKNPDSLKTGTIIGVVKDFNYKSLYDKVEVAVLQIFPDAAWKVAVKLKTANTAAALGAIRSAWNRFTPEYPIEYKFLDENFEQMYVAEDKLQSLLFIFTSIAVFVACLGLFGLATYTAERRRKEIGIRKLLGASVQGVVILLSKDFIKLVVISLIIASPFAWYFMQSWLQDFAYRIDLGWLMFILPAFLILLIAFGTVSIQIIKAATANPVKNLRVE